MKRTKQEEEEETKQPAKRSKRPASKEINGLFYEDKLPSRLTCILYCHNITTGETSYGASLFRQDLPNEFQTKFGGKKKVLKKALRNTALARFTHNPVMLNVASTSRRDLHEKLRHALRRYGVNGKRAQTRLDSPDADWKEKKGYKITPRMIAENKNAVAAKAK